MHLSSKIQRKESVIKPIAVLLILLLFFSLTAYAHPDHIIVGCGDFRPMFFQSEDQGIDGRDIDLWRLWSQKTGFTVEFRVMEWNKVIPALLAHEIDVANGATHTPERAKIMAFTQPHEELLSYLFFHKNTYPFRSISDLSEKIVGVLKGSNIEEYLSLTVPDATVIAASNYEELVTDALEGRTQVFVAEEPLASYYINKFDSTNEFKRSLNPILDSSLSMAVRH
ncbi:MAG: transporter substrate-binding domain-containing protein, partial [Candidatus Hydrogenedentes bacterium]|nr:transporter substrate-binding domain-containing protein [Candidatus Hydrogenedentota bacterium]